MKVNRRAFLQLVSPALLLPGVTVRAGAQAASDALFLNIVGIDHTTPSDRLSAFIDPFLDGELPIALVLRAPGPADPALSPGVASVLARILVGAHDRIEPVLALPAELAALPPYFQRRMTSDGLQWLADLIASPALPTPMTLATNAEQPGNYDALRCLGVRSVLTLAQTQDVSSTGCATLAVCLTGATAINVADTADPAEVIDRALSRPGWAQFAFSLAGVDQLTLADVRLRGLRAVDAIARELDQGHRFLALPRDHALWFGQDQSRFVATRLDQVSAGDSGGRAELAAGLRAHGIPFSETLPLDALGADWPTSACLDLPSSALRLNSANEATVPDGPRCAVADSPDPALSTGTAAALDLLTVPTAQNSFDDQGLLVRGETSVARAALLLERSDRMRDAIIVIRSEDVRTAEARATTLATLLDLQADQTTTLVDLPAFVQATVTPDPVFDLLRDSRRAQDEPPDPHPLTTEDWMADARQAWTFFERFSNAETGLCVDTADVQGKDEWLHGELTMWDLGSLIAGVMAAHELGLIPDQAFVDRAAQLVRALPARKIGGRLLPGEVIATDTGKPLSDNFNACDTGRLLSVLRELDAHPLTPAISAQRVKEWDLASVIIDGHVHSVVNGALVDRFQSHCAHYTARAFRDRGHAAASPYEVADPASDTDRAMTLLHSLRGFGALGAEPLLFEALEMGMSDPSELLASVLFSAQKQDFEQSNTLYCVSEAPLNREPWFTYQGLDLTASQTRWMVGVTSHKAQFNSDAFRQEVALVNTKAAYLWAAYRPGPYATRLVRHVRDRARLSEIGFSPGVFVATGEAMSGYADVNTNAIVLEAIAFILRGRKPRLAAG